MSLSAVPMCGQTVLVPLRLHLEAIFSGSGASDTERAQLTRETPDLCSADFSRKSRVSFDILKNTSHELVAYVVFKPRYRF